MDTHLSQFYGTDHVPSETGLLEIEKVAPHNARMVRLEKDLQEAEAKIARLRKEKEDVLRMIKPLKSLSSLIRRFPREIMELIFIHSMSTTAPERPNLSICHAPLALLRVCKLWREIALTTPQLWASVELTIPAHLRHSFGNAPDAKKQQRVASFLDLFDRWLERSESYPLSIIVRRYHRDDGTTVRSLASKLATHSRRWESIDYDISLVPHNPFADIAAESLPSLKYARLSAYSFPFGRHNEPRFLGILSAPNLKGLQIQVSHSSHGISKMPVNWTNLTHLFLDGDYTRRRISSQDDQLTAIDSKMLAVLEKCQNLRICSLLLHFTGNLLPEPEPQVTLPKLEALNVTGCRLQIHHLLQSITTPRIREIHYQPFFPSSLPNEAPPFSPALPLTSFLQRYGNRTEVLTVNLPTVPREDLQSWLECTPILKQLTLGEEFQFAPPPPVISSSTSFETPFEDPCIDFLTPKQDQPYLCPNLKIFRCSMKAHIPVDTILAFLKAKTDRLLVGNGGIIEEVSIHQLAYDFPFGNSTDAEDERVKSIREAGVRLSFKKSVDYPSNPAPTIINGPPSASMLGPGYGVDFKLF
ncbi:hypothetical protein EST38_g3774 [Candolleomyces aberdarensis]|uniref:Uncharacterized protein n=1 Tax=Candolleomyces aberdarensis TaxID=2316362 RepID=A0A4Q2DS79_9AGAR|nr:hypothetical protein EST38_g3774 [Candolleomyces aberdarensis]